MTVTLEEAQAKVPERIRNRTTGDELHITDNGVVVATVVPVAPPPPSPKPPRQLGTLRGTVLYNGTFRRPD